ncbi:hypothetical protein Tco_0428259 [Tanacetum coccineum]
MWGYVSGTKTKPVDGDGDNYAVLLDTWEVDNSKVITWINNSVTPSIGAQLAKYDSAKAVWDHLARLYTQDSQHLVQFLMALRNDFEGLRGSILHRNPLPSVDSVVSELLGEEVCLKSHDDKNIVEPLFLLLWEATDTSEWPPQQQRPSHPNNGVAAPFLDQSLIEQFQKFLAFQPQALATYSSNGCSSPGPINSESDWDRL